MTTFPRTVWAIGLIALGAAAMQGAAQQVGTVGVRDATVSGSLEVSNGRAVLMGASTVTARDHTAEIALQRGGTVKVCSTSGLHLAAGKGAGEAPLMLALDRGAIEVATHVTPSDAVITPDMRFTMKSAGTLDLRVRVARNGDTCVENRGASAPVLDITDQFGESAYEVKPGQHVLFERGSLKEVVDNEREPCGCPAAPIVSVADAGVTGANAAAPGSSVAAQTRAKTAAEQHPFPAAESAGLAPVNTPPQAPAGAVHAQVSTTMSYGGENGAGSDGSGDNGAAAASSPSSSVPAKDAANATVAQTPPAPAADNATASRAEAPPPPAAPPPGDVFHAISRFFRRLFGGH